MFNIYDSHSLSEIALKGLANTGAYLARKGVAKAIKSDYAKKKIKNVANKYLDQALDSLTSDLSKKISGSGIPLPFPFVDWKKAWNVVSDPGLFKGPEISAKEGKALVAEYKRQ